MGIHVLLQNTENQRQHSMEIIKLGMQGAANTQSDELENRSPNLKFFTAL